MLNPQNTQPTVGFDASERAWLRRELATQFDASPPIADGFPVKVWKSGPDKGSPRMPPPVKSMVKRNILVIKSIGHGYRAFFTDEGLRELRRLFENRRLMDISEFGDLPLQLGLKRTDYGSTGRP
jgi:hypothetical protein